MSLRSPNKEQFAAIKYQTGPLLLLAGAGTGKTEVITRRISYLLKHRKAQPNEILAITFTEKAAQEMQDRLSEALGTYTYEMKVTTFNSFGQDILDRFGFDIGLHTKLNLLTEKQQLIFMRENIDRLQLKYYAPITDPLRLMGELAGYFSRLKSQLITPELYTKFVQKLLKSASTIEAKAEANRQRELAGAYNAYCRLLRERGLIDFDDQVFLTVELLEKKPHLLDKLKTEIKWLLIDEFQDTNLPQSRLIDLLAGEAGNVMVVGDDDQSIYHFRGAALTNILEFLERHPKSKQLALIRNYRSSQEILDSAYRLIQFNNPDRLEAKYGLSKQLIAQFHGPKPEFKTFSSYEEEAQWVASDIKRRLKAGQSPSQLAVLLRQNQQSRILAKYLDAQNLDYQVIGQNQNLYTQPEVRIILYFLKIMVDPLDDASLYHLLVSEVYRFDPAMLRRFTSMARQSGQSLEAVLQAAGREGDLGLNNIERVLSALEQWRTLLPTLSVGQLSYRFIKDSGYLGKLMKTRTQDAQLDLKLRNLNQFFTSLLEYERIANDVSAVGFIYNLPALEEAGERLIVEDLPDIYGQKIRILTVHKAKGLEFEVVYLFDLTQDTFPGRAKPHAMELPLGLTNESPLLTGDPHLQEERRLMYVAMTRAKRELILSYSPDHGGKRAKQPSVFISEALGILPEIGKPVLRTAATKQIELFNTVNRPRLGKKAELPLHLLQNGRLALTERQIEDYLMCPAEFYFRHILSPPQPLSFALEYGNLMHNLIQLYNRRRLAGQVIKLEELLDYLGDNWPRAGFVSADHERRSLAQARATLRKFWRRELENQNQPTAIEKSFQFELPEGRVAIRGRLDAVYESVQGVEIRDYKTGGRTVDTKLKADQKAKASLQLAIYALGWQINSGILPNLLTLDFIDSGLIGETVKTEAQLIRTRQKILNVANGIRLGDWRAGSSHIFCTHMEYGL